MLLVAFGLTLSLLVSINCCEGVPISGGGDKAMKNDSVITTAAATIDLDAQLADAWVQLSRWQRQALAEEDAEVLVDTLRALIGVIMRERASKGRELEQNVGGSIMTEVTVDSSGADTTTTTTPRPGAIKEMKREAQEARSAEGSDPEERVLKQVVFVEVPREGDETRKGGDVDSGGDGGVGKTNQKTLVYVFPPKVNHFYRLVDNRKGEGVHQPPPPPSVHFLTG